MKWNRVLGIHNNNGAEDIPGSHQCGAGGGGTKPIVLLRVPGP